jgi:hypothetical protein
MSDGRAINRENTQTVQPIVVLDANAWINELMLNSFVGASLVDFLAQSTGKILLPEIVEEELTRGICAGFSA